MSLRGPTEAEWDYAARAGTRSRRFWGDAADQGCGFANGADLSAKARFPDWSTTNCEDSSVYSAPDVGWWLRCADPPHDH